jgi:hypothetical protein
MSDPSPPDAGSMRCCRRFRVVPRAVSATRLQASRLYVALLGSGVTFASKDWITNQQ